MDRTSPKLSSLSHSPEPVQGWEQWCQDFEDIVGVCESEQAIELVQERNRELLIALSRQRAELYRQLGNCVGARRGVLKAAQKRSRKRLKEPTGTLKTVDREKELA